jgi:hypothetical protein
MRAIAFICLCLIFLSGCSDGEVTDPVEFDLDFNRGLFWEPVGADYFVLPSPEVDSYWIDSWTADGEAKWWYTPEKYDFSKGDTIVTCVAWIQTENNYELIRYDGFYFCGEENWRRYIAYGWQDFGVVPPIEPNYCYIHGIFYDTSFIRDRLLPLTLDWAHKSITNTQKNYWHYGGVPLCGRPPCFYIEK